MVVAGGGGGGGGVMCDAAAAASISPHCNIEIALASNFTTFLDCQASQMPFLFSM